MKLGEEVEIGLWGNPTTGYSWVADYAHGLFDISRDYSTLGVGNAGGGGTYTFRVRAVKSGAGKLTLEYKRSWDIDHLDKLTYEIEVV